MRFYLNERLVGSFAELVAAQPDSAFGSPTRSTLALLDFWRDPEERCRDFAAIISVTSHPETELIFEHQVSVRQGSGKPSCTDLLIRYPSTVIAIEAKYTEPRYETVSDWLRAGDLCNRIDVLRGWISLLEAVSGKRLSVRSISALPYQLIHRTASACAPDARRRLVIYHIFEQSPHEYVEDMRSLASILGTDSNLELIVLSTPVDSMKEHRALKDLWKSKASGVSERLRTALIEGGLFEFGPTTREFSSGAQTVG